MFVGVFELSKAMQKRNQHRVKFHVTGIQCDAFCVWEGNKRQIVFDLSATAADGYAHLL